MTVVVTRSMRKKQEKEGTWGKFVKPSNTYKDGALTRTGKEDVATFIVENKESWRMLPNTWNWNFKISLENDWLIWQN
jgi:hypothetical protein